MGQHENDESSIGHTKNSARPGKAKPTGVVSEVLLQGKHDNQNRMWSVVKIRGLHGLGSIAGPGYFKPPVVCASKELDVLGAQSGVPLVLLANQHYCRPAHAT